MVEPQPSKLVMPVRSRSPAPPPVHHGGMSLVAHTAAERPDLWERGIASGAVWPEYNLHGDDLNRWWGHLDEELPEYQFVLYDDAADEVLAEGHTGPLGGTAPTTHCRAASTRRSASLHPARAGEPVDTLCALAAEMPARDPFARPGRRAPHRDARDRRAARAQAPDRAGAPVVQGALSADADRALRDLAARRRAAARPLDARARTARRPGRHAAPALDADHRDGRGVGELDRLAFPESGDYVFPRGWPCSTSTAPTTAAPTGSPTSG